jgi:restriction system protein
LLDSPERGVVSISERGRKVLAENPQKIDVRFLEQFSEFQEFRNRDQDSKATVEDSVDAPQSKAPPEELLENSYTTLKTELQDEVLSKIKSCSPQFFERLVVDTIVKMGYGGSRQEAGRAVGQSSDEGIDGIINEDRLGLDVIYLQAKRWEGNVSRPEIQKFAGALQGKRARKGIFITTSDFTNEAREFARHIDSKIILISGRQLVDLMWEYNIGVTPAVTYEVKRIDSDFFVE